MALATLCRDVTRTRQSSRTSSSFLDLPETTTNFIGFVVDHRLRGGSDEEANNVATELSRLGIEARILTLDWQSYGDPSRLENVESAARRLRYQAIGRACYESGINSLLVAHHRDDQAETVLMRMVGGYTGSGLSGIRPLAAIPECRGMYGVDQSGDSRAAKPTDEALAEKDNTKPSRPQMHVEQGGVTLGRPLLEFSKPQLLKICEQAGTRWYEDPTNNQVGMTPRNTIRHLIEKDYLPSALAPQRLLALAESVRQRREHVEDTARDIWLKSRLEINTNVGEARFTLPQTLLPKTNDAHELTLYTHVLRHLLSVVTPKDASSLQDLDLAARAVFPPDAMERLKDKDKCDSVQIAGVTLTRSQSTEWTWGLRRSPPTREQQQTGQMTLWPAPVQDSASTVSDWNLWDNRYWIRVTSPPSFESLVSRVYARFLSQEDIQDVRKHSKSRHLGDPILRVPDQLRRTVPVIVTEFNDHRGICRESPVAIPAFAWTRDNWDDWDIRFKSVDRRFKAFSRHQSEMTPKRRGQFQT